MQINNLHNNNKTKNYNQLETTTTNNHNNNADSQAQLLYEEDHNNFEDSNNNNNHRTQQQAKTEGEDILQYISKIRSLTSRVKVLELANIKMRQLQKYGPIWAKEPNIEAFATNRKESVKISALMAQIEDLGLMCDEARRFFSFFFVRPMLKYLIIF